MELPSVLIAMYPKQPINTVVSAIRAIQAKDAIESLFNPSAVATRQYLRALFVSQKAAGQGCWGKLVYPRVYPQCLRGHG